MLGERNGSRCSGSKVEGMGQQVVQYTLRREAQSELSTDFVGGAVGYRLRSNTARNHPLARAVGLTRARSLRVVDATAGLGRDAFLLASLGAQVTLLERNATVYALLTDGLARARDANQEIAAIVDRMTIVYGDARELLPGLHADVIVVDPMHPTRKKTALVKKEMRLLRDMVGPDSDALELMEIALTSGSKRVVLKWPSKAPLPLSVPTYEIRGKTIRFLVYARSSIGR